jgi:hypothetical protein
MIERDGKLCFHTDGYLHFIQRAAGLKIIGKQLKKP